MGELLRAICDATALDAQSAFYTSPGLAQTVTFTGVNTFIQKTTSIQCKTDTWFLMMSWTMNTAFTAAGVGFGNWLQKANASKFTIQDGATSTIYSNGTVPKPNQSYTLNNIVYLPEYILWPPSSVIVFIEDVRATDAAIARSDIDYITLTGIEYKMPEGY